MRGKIAFCLPRSRVPATFNRFILCFTALVCLTAASCAPQAGVNRTKKKPGAAVHTVNPGESLYLIAKAYDVSLEELARVNQLKNPHQIRPGQKIIIPGAARELPAPVVTTTETKTEMPPAPQVSPTAHDGFMWPVSGTINSYFGRRGSTVHDGIDVAAAEGTPIRAVEAGEVIYSDQLRGYGNLVIIRHGDGFASVYAHNQVNLVKEGQTVARGDIIGKVGSTGRVSGPHLHFEIRKNNIAQDPLKYLPPLCCAPAADRVSAME